MNASKNLIPFGAALLVALPPSAAPDEGYHLGRIWTLSEGHLRLPAPGESALSIPRSIAELSRAVNGEESERTRSSSLSPTQPLPKRTDPMLALLEFLDSLPDWMTSWTFILSMAALLIGLIIVLMIVRNKRPEDD